MGTHTKNQKNEKPRDAKVVTHHQHLKAQLVSETCLLWKNSLTVTECDITSAHLFGQFSQLSQLCTIPASFPPSDYLQSGEETQ